MSQVVIITEDKEQLSDTVYTDKYVINATIVSMSIYLAEIGAIAEKAVVFHLN